MSIHIVEELRFKLKELALGMWPEASGIQFDVAEPNIEEHGDIAVNIALVLSKKVKKAPMVVAEELVATIQKQGWSDDYFSQIEIKQPGFINFFLKPEFLLGNIEQFIRGLSEVKRKNKKVIIEHTSVNPNKAMHIGHLRNSILGDVMQRVWQRTGYDTEVQYYVDDTGVQVADTTIGLHELQLKQEPGEKFDHFCWRVYTAINEAYEKNPELLEKRKALLHALEDSSTEEAKAARAQSEKIIADHLTTLDKFSIGFDVLAWESDVLALGFWKSAFEILKKADVFVQESEGKNSGCWVIKMGDESNDDDEHDQDKIIVRSDGTVTYTGKDLAYNFWKFNLLGKDFLYSEWNNAPQEKPLWTTNTNGKESNEFGNADYVYTLIDVRQTYPQEMIRKALDSLGYEREARHFHHASYGVVSLSSDAAKDLGVDTGDDKKAYSMSGRKGIGIKVDEVFDAVVKKVAAQEYAKKSENAGKKISDADVAAGAIKYFMLKFNQKTDIVFDYADVLSLEGNTGPYIQYAHARTASLLQKADSASLQAGGDTLSSFERKLLRKIYLWPSVLTTVEQELQVNAITNYLFELANAFNSFYENDTVLNADEETKKNRLAIVAATKHVLADGLSVLGIVAPDSM